MMADNRQASGRAKLEQSDGDAGAAAARLRAGASCTVLFKLRLRISRIPAMMHTRIVHITYHLSTTQ